MNRSGKGCNENTSWNTSYMSRDQLCALIEDVFDSQRTSKMPSRYAAKFYIENNLLNMFTRVSPTTVLRQVEEMYSTYNSLNVHVIKTYFGSYKEIYISCY